MRICYLTEADISLNNGRGINEREFIDAALRSPIVDFRCVAPEPARPDNYHRQRIDYVKSHAHSSIQYIAFVLDAYRTIAAMHDREGLDAVATRLDVSPIVARAVQSRLEIPVLLKMLVLRGAFSRAGGSRLSAVSIVKKAFRPLFRAVVENAAGMDAPSPVLAEELRERFGLDEDLLTVIRNGANLSRFSIGDAELDRRRLGLEEFDRLVGYVGVLEKRRHLDSLIQGFSEVASDGGNFGLVIVGQGPARRQLEEMANELGVDQNVVFTGRVPYEEVPSYMRTFHAGVDLSATPVDYNGRLRNASFSQKTGQYLGCGCPVISWDLDDTHFLEESDIGWTIPFGGSRGIAKVLRAVRDADETRIRESRARCRRYAEEMLGAEILTQRRLKFWVSRIEARN